MSDVNQWLLLLPEDERRHLLGLDKWRLADKVWDVALPKWIPVSERLPEGGGDVLLISRGGDCSVWDAHLVRSIFQAGIDEGHGCYFTHWMPLPEPPEG